MNLTDAGLHEQARQLESDLDLMQARPPRMKEGLVYDALVALRDAARAEQRERDSGLAYEVWDPALEYANSCCQRASARIQKIIAAAIRVQEASRER